MKTFTRNPRRHIKYMTSPGNETHPMMLPQKIDTRNSDFSSKRWNSPKSHVANLKIKKRAHSTRREDRSVRKETSPKTFLKSEVVGIHGQLDDLSASIDDWIDFLTIDPCQRKKKKLNPRHHRLASNEVWFGDSSESYYPRYSRAGSETTSLSPSPNQFRLQRWSASPPNNPAPSAGKQNNPPLRKKRGAAQSTLRGLLEDKSVVFKSFKRHEGPLMGGKRFYEKPNINRFDSIALKKRPTQASPPRSSILYELPEEDYLESFSPSSSSSLASSEISVPKVETSTTSDGVALDDTFFEISGMNTEHGYAHEKKWRHHFDLQKKHFDNPDLLETFTTASVSVERLYGVRPEVASEDLWNGLGDV